MRHIIFIIIVIFLSFFVNHKVYGNSNTTISNYEIIKNFEHELSTENNANLLADYMYGRIKYYQQFNNKWKREYMFFKLYETLQNME